MKKTMACLLLATLLLCCGSGTAWAAAPELEGESYVLVEGHSGEVLAGHNATAKWYPASTTKIMTLVLALEAVNSGKVSLEDIVTTSEYAASMGGSQVYLYPGEERTLKEMLIAVAVGSGNDASVAVAEFLAGSEEAFVEQMNAKAQELGMTGTHFANPHGLHDENHYTTAYDLAVIMKYCVQNNDFRRIAGSASVAIPATNKSGVRKYDSTNDLIIPNNKNYYQYITSGKTGFTTPAGECLVSCAYKNDIELICVILGGNQTVDNSSLRFSETKKLYEYGYNNYSMKPIVNEGNSIYSVTIDNATKETKNLDLIAQTDVSAIVNNDFSIDNLEPSITLNQNLTAPIEGGTTMGFAEYDIDGVKYTVNLIASHDVEKFSILDYSFYFVAGFLLILVIIFLVKMRKKK